MFKHRIAFIGTWITFVIVLAFIPGFEMRGFAMGLVIGYWPVVFFSMHSLHPIIVILTMFVLSGATVGFCAWFMDKANMPDKIWALLIVLMIVGAYVLSKDNISYEGWQRTPAISAAMESPEVNYQPTRSDFYHQIVIPKALAGSMLGLYTTTGICFIYSIAILLRRRYLVRQTSKDTS